MLNAKFARAVFFCALLIMASNVFAADWAPGGGFKPSVRGQGVAGQVSFWTTGAEIGGDSLLFWDNSKKALIVGGSYSNARVNVDAGGAANGLFINNANYGLVAAGKNNGIQGQGTGLASTGVYGIGEYIGVSGTSKGNGGYAVYAQQSDPSSYAFYGLGGKNYLSGPLELGSGLKIGTANRRGGITIFDETDGSPYCLKVVAGVFQTSAGECAY